MGISRLFKATKPYAYHLKDENGDDMVEEFKTGKGKNEEIEEKPYIFYIDNPNDSDVITDLTKEYQKRKNPSDASYKHYMVDCLVETISDWTIYDDKQKEIPFTKDACRDLLANNASIYLFQGAFLAMNDATNFTKGATSK